MGLASVSSTSDRVSKAISLIGKTKNNYRLATGEAQFQMEGSVTILL